MRGSIKRVVSIGFAFITSFLLTVTAYGAVASEGDSTNGNYLGKYTNDSTIGYIWAQKSNMVIFTYKDSGMNYYVTGTTKEYSIKPGKSGYQAVFRDAARVTEDGDTVMDNARIPLYKASGSVAINTNIFGVITKVKISSEQSGLVYEK